MIGHTLNATQRQAHTVTINDADDHDDDDDDDGGCRCWRCCCGVICTFCALSRARDLVRLNARSRDRASLESLARELRDQY